MKRSDIHNRPIPVTVLITAVLLILSGGCNRSEDQLEFEKEAFRMPENYTSTTPNGRVENRDESDWNIGPMFRGYVEVDIPPFPNPTRSGSETVQIELLITGTGTVHGLRAVVYYDMFDDRSWRMVDEHDQSPVEDMLVVLDINPAAFDRNYNFDNARNVNDGLHRLFIYDNRNNLITYGDIKLE